MNFLVGIICFILGFILGVFTRNILIKVASINNKIKMAEKIIAEEEKRKNLNKSMTSPIALKITKRRKSNWKMQFMIEIII